MPSNRTITNLAPPFPSCHWMDCQEVVCRQPWSPEEESFVGLPSPDLGCHHEVHVFFKSWVIRHNSDSSSGDNECLFKCHVIEPLLKYFLKVEFISVWTFSHYLLSLLQLERQRRFQSTKHFWSSTAKRYCSILPNNSSRWGLVLKQ